MGDEPVRKKSLTKALTELGQPSGYQTLSKGGTERSGGSTGGNLEKAIAELGQLAQETTRLAEGEIRAGRQSLDNTTWDLLGPRGTSQDQPEKGNDRAN